MHKYLSICMIWLSAVLLLAGCSAPASSGPGLKVVATTTLVGDVVRQVGGEHIALTVLLPVGADPHSFEPRPQDMAALSEAQLVFINGLHLEESLEETLEANVKGQLVSVSDGITPLPFTAEHEGEEEDEHAAGDPHTWMSPLNVIIWANHIAAALSQADPDHAADYHANAEAYIVQLEQLDGWIRQQVALVPAENRQLVTDHATLGYFAQQYGFQQVGLVVRSLSASAAPSAQELADLQDAIQAQGVKAIFVGTTVNPALSEQIAEDTGVKLIFFYTGSLSQAGGGAESYLDFMRYNVSAIVEALK
ncbi:MAG: zinc ABC transporter substrate-binding protein [Anaerolineales bacterium]|nr:zinc ABC transporter substrate-binding protein [Anaerolineales bacterium]